MDSTLTTLQSLATDSRTTAALGKARQNVEDLKGSKKAAEDFESVFLSQMLNIMFAALPTDGPFGGGAAEESFRPLLVDQYSRMMSQNGGVGLSDAVQKEMLKLQEEASL
jgi:peptidoglycan hydrolase FlgJ